MTADSNQVSTLADHVRRHRAGSAWTDRGTAELVSGGPGGWPLSVRCHRRAIELLSGLPVGENISYLADLGAAWVNLGCALQAGPSPESVAEALPAFDRAIELLEHLPITSHPRFRHNLAAAWMNRAEAMVRRDAATSRAGALQAYGRAIEIARELPLDEKPSFRILLASCWINRGNLLQRLSHFSEAVPAYDEALAALGNLPKSCHRLACHHAATAWTNRGEACLRLDSRDGAEQAVDSASMALAQVEGRDLGGPADAKLSLRALRLMTGGLESLLFGGGPGQNPDRVAALTDVAERGINLALGCRDRAPELFDPFIAWFFSRGSRVYGSCQPQFLAEFIEEVLQCRNSRANPAVEAKLRATARQALAKVLPGLCRNRLIIEGTPATELLLRTVHRLRAAAASLNS